MKRVRNGMRRAAAWACLRLASRLSDCGRLAAAHGLAELAGKLTPGDAEPWVALGTIRHLMGRESAALEAMMGANARDPGSRVIALMAGLILDELQMCEESYRWLVRAAHAAGKSKLSLEDGHDDGMFWQELGQYCLGHGRYEEALEVGALAALNTGRSGGAHAR